MGVNTEYCYHWNENGNVCISRAGINMFCSFCSCLIPQDHFVSQNTCQRSATRAFLYGGGLSEVPLIGPGTVENPSMNQQADSFSWTILVRDM